MTERKPYFQETAKEAVKPVKIIWGFLGEPIASILKEQYTTTKLLSLFDKLATKFPRSKVISAASESLKKRT